LTATSLAKLHFKNSYLFVFLQIILQIQKWGDNLIRESWAENCQKMCSKSQFVTFVVL